MKFQAKGGALGVDAPSASKVCRSGTDQEMGDLYKLWNRMNLGSYVPAQARAVEIPKEHGIGVRVLGVTDTVDHRWTSGPYPSRPQQR